MEKNDNPFSEDCQKKAGDCYGTCPAVPTTCEELEDMLGACASTCPSCVQEEVALIIGCSTTGITSLVKEVVDTKTKEQDENPISEGCKKKAGDCYDTCSAVPTTCEELGNMLGACASTCPSCVQEEMALLLDCSGISEDCKKKAGDCYDSCPAVPTTCEELEDMLDTCASTCPSCVQEEAALNIGCSTTGITSLVKEVVDTKTTEQDENPISDGCKKKAGDCYDTCSAVPTTCEELEDMLGACASTCPSCVQEEVASLIGCSTTGIATLVKEAIHDKTMEQNGDPFSEDCKKKAGDCYDTCPAVPTTCEELEDMLGGCASTCPSCVQEEVASIMGCSTTGITIVVKK